MTRTESGGRLLLVDDDPGLLRLLTLRLQAEGHTVEAVASAAAALAVLPRFAPDLVITDLRMEKMDGIGLLREIQRQRPGLKVLLLTAHGTIPDAVEATQSGAFGFLTKPVDREELKNQIARALRVSVPSSEKPLDTDLVTRNPAMQELLAQLPAMAAADGMVLVSGASGTGKNLLARALHRASPRHDRPLLRASCSAMPADRLEAELFGEAASGGHGAREGLFRAADGGTLVLDEIGDMPLRLQAKLLRVLEEAQVHPLGASSAPVPVNVRLVSTTHRDLLELMEAGQFREDLYFRLNVMHLRVPPLSARREDIPLLVDHFLDLLARDGGRERQVCAPEALEMLVAAPWPGNVRELENKLRQAAAQAPGAVITAAQVAHVLGRSPDEGMPSFADARDEFTRNYLRRLLQLTDGNVSQAARLAKRNRTDFYKLLNRYDVQPDEFKSRS